MYRDLISKCVIMRSILYHLEQSSFRITNECVPLSTFKSKLKSWLLKEAFG